MAFTYTITDRGASGNKKYQAGAFTNAGTADTGGAIVVPMERPIMCNICNSSNANAVKVELGTARQVTITTTAGDDGTYYIEGK